MDLHCPLCESKKLTFIKATALNSYPAWNYCYIVCDECAYTGPKFYYDNSSEITATTTAITKWKEEQGVSIDGRD